MNFMSVCNVMVLSNSVTHEYNVLVTYKTVIVLAPLDFGTDMNKKNTLSTCNKDIYLHLNMNIMVDINTISFPIYREYVIWTYGGVK